MKPHSITRRIVTLTLLAQLVAATVLCFVAFFHQTGARLHALDTRIQGRADSLLGAIQDAEDAEDNVHVDPSELQLPDEDSWAVYNTDGRLVGRSDRSPFVSDVMRRTDGVWDYTFGRVQYRVLQFHALRIIDRSETAGTGLKRPVILLYASPKTHLVHEAFESASFYMLTALLVSGVTAVVVALLLRFSLSPIPELASSAKRIAVPSLEFTMPSSVEQVIELAPLANVLAEVTGKLRDAFAREQRFLGDAAHELKTAVAVGRSTLQLMLLKDRTTDQYREGLARALEDNQRIEALVVQMLNLSRMEEAQQSPFERVDLAETAWTVINDLKSLASQAGIVVASHLSHGSLIDLAQERAHVLISNLLANAIQYSKAGSVVSVSVTIERSLTVLTVQDQGIGISQEALPHIFERFFRADPSRARDTGGSGLGLAICKTIVDHADASIAVKSNPGAGTTVTVTFTQI